MDAFRLLKSVHIGKKWMKHNKTSIQCCFSYWFFFCYSLPLQPVPAHPHFLFTERPSKPVFEEKPPRQILVSTGETVTLRCKARGAPVPDVRWEHDGTVLTHGSGISKLEVGPVTGNSTYICVVISSLGHLEAVTDVVLEVMNEIRKLLYMPIMMNNFMCVMRLYWACLSRSRLLYCRCRLQVVEIKNNDILNRIDNSHL